MNIVVIGLGSMGKRRVRLIQEMFPSYRIFGVDSRQDRCEESTAMFNIPTFSSIDEVGKTIDCAFICTSPLSHASIVKECLMKKWNVFTEINLVDNGYSENIHLAKKMECTLFLSSTFLYREETKYIMSHVTRDANWNYLYHVGQYLPDWHPWENYNDFFIGDQRTNGCREIMAIELPWIIRTFGEIKDFHVISDKMSKLNIGFHDNFMIQFIHETGNKGTLIVDVVNPYAERRFEAYTEGKYLSWDGTPETVFEFDSATKSLKNVVLTEKTEHEKGYQGFIVENAYKNEIQEFFDVVQHGKTPIYGLEQDQKILKLIESLGA